jgi:hypothetical protein
MDSGSIHCKIHGNQESTCLKCQELDYADMRMFQERFIGMSQRVEALEAKLQKAKEALDYIANTSDGGYYGMRKLFDFARAALKELADE